MNKNCFRIRIGLIFFLSFTLLAAAAPGASAKPMLVVAISVDQMRADYLTKFQKYFSGGFKWLHDSGVVFQDAHQNHFLTETAPGHSTLLTGLNPGSNGIVANYWYDRDRRALVYCTADDAYPILDNAKAEGRSPRSLRATTLGDWIKAQSPQSRVVSLAGKDRSAILMAGQDADEVLWYNEQNGRMETSTYYQRRYAKWVDSFNKRQLPVSYFGKTWDYLKPAEFYRQFGPDDAPNEGGSDRTFPHVIGGFTALANASFYSSFIETPFLDEVVLTAAREAVTANQLGKRDVTDVLCVGLSATDYIGHAFGPSSHEMADQLLRLDLFLQQFIDFLKAEVGAENLVIVLSADHGVLPLPEELSSHGTRASRLTKQDRLLFQRLNDHLSRKLGFKENWILGYYSTNIYLNYPALGQHDLKRSEVEAAAKEYLLGLPAVAAVYGRSDIHLAVKNPDPILKLLRNAFNEARSGDVIIQFRENYIPSTGTTGTTHGSPYRYDSWVPLVLFKRATGHKTIPEEVHTTDIAPTLAELLGVKTPEKLDGVSRLRLLTQAAAGN
ncbi:MAG TPA: alkaline phosphatase family protein [Acidobacteriota bacterium]|jgi:predicted AlkP superfamily pyrophosphatase or phosphodiesterase